MTTAIVPKELLTATLGGLSLLVVSGGTDRQVLTQQADGTYAPEAVSAGIGGSVGSKDNRLVRSDGTGGSTVQSTGITVDDSNNISGIGTISTGVATLNTVTIKSDGGFASISPNAGRQFLLATDHVQLWRNGTFTLILDWATDQTLKISDGSSGFYDLQARAITASGVITAPSNSAHTFGSAGTQVSLAAGVVTIAGSGLTRTLTATAAGIASNRGFQCDNGSVYFAYPPTGLIMKSGTGARAGTATLVAGTVTVTNTSVSASTRIFLTVRTTGGTLGTLSYTLSAGASFTINSSSASDTSTVTYFLIEVI